jgi:PAS domain S-box-containing protein
MFTLRDRLRELTESARHLARDESNLDVLRDLIDRLPVAALVADMHGQYVAANNAAAALTGYTVSELARLSVWQLTPNANEHEAETLWRAFLLRHEQHGEYPIVTRHNRVVVAEYAASTNVLPGLHLSLLRPKPQACELDRTSVPTRSG